MAQLTQIQSRVTAVEDQIAHPQVLLLLIHHSGLDARWILRGGPCVLSFPQRCAACFWIEQPDRTPFSRRCAPSVQSTIPHKPR